MSSSNGFFAHQRNAHRNANAGTTLKRRIDNRGCGGAIGGLQDDRIHYAPPQKRARFQTQTRFQSANPGMIPLYHDGSNVSRVSNYGDVIRSNSSNCFPFAALRNNDSSLSNADYQKPFGYGNPNPNPQLVPLPLPYRKLDDFDSLPEWVPNRSNFPIRSPNFVPDTNRDRTGVRFNAHSPSQAPVFTNVPNAMPMNYSNTIVSQAMPQQPILSKELSDLLSRLNHEKEKQNSTNSNESPVGLDFGSVNLNVRNKSVIKSLYPDMPWQSVIKSLYSDMPKQNSTNSNESPVGLDFGSVNLNVRNESVIKSLYSDMPRQCSSCGVRFKCQEEHSKHMDWHVRKNRMAKDATKTTTRSSQKPKKSRGWFASSSLWLAAATGGTIEAAKASFGETMKTKEEEKQRHTVPADENQKLCALCVEPFEEFFSHEEDEWLYNDAVYLNMELGPIVHVKCMP